jgi:uncharacterized protein YggE
MPPLRLILLTFLIVVVVPSYGRTQMRSPSAVSSPPLPAPAPMRPFPPPWPPGPNGDGQVPPAPPGTRVIEVNGNGEIQAAPDLATVEIAIETHAASADHAAGLNGALAEKVRDALMSKLGDKGRMWTGGYSLTPEYTEAKEGKPTVTGYTAENSITVQTGELGLVGPVIDAAIGAGANRISSLNYSLRADSKARSEAIAKAAHDAQTQAAALANALGLRLGPVIRASTQLAVRPAPLPRFSEAATMVSNVQTPVAAGEITVPAAVSLTYSIE